MGHSVRSCVIGMRLAEQIGMDLPGKADLYYALLLKDAGCSSNASKLFHILNADEIRAKRDVKLTDWTRTGWDSLRYAFTHVATGLPFLQRMRTLAGVAARQQVESCALVQIRCDRGASVARQIGFPNSVAEAIASLDEHWNGGGYPMGLQGEEIPLFSRIMNVAQTLEVFFANRGPAAALEVARRRSKRWFDPNLVRAAESLARSGLLWLDLDTDCAVEDVLALEPEERRMEAGDALVENVCEAFAQIIDAKSPFTFHHSHDVSNAAVAIARHLSLTREQVTFLRRAALLHDIGKLSVPNSILEKPDKLDADEWAVVKKHPYYTLEILRRIPGFEVLGEVAASHHEKLDGSGYFRGYTAEQMPLPARILAVADIYAALIAKRPYREALPPEQVFRIMRKDAPKAIDADCLEALAHTGDEVKHEEFSQTI